MAKMKMFALRADCLFMAKDIVDAFRKLSRHFTDMKKGIDSKLLHRGSISITPSLDDGTVFVTMRLSKSQTIQMTPKVVILPGSVVTISSAFTNDTADIFELSSVALGGSLVIREPSVKQEG